MKRRAFLIGAAGLAGFCGWRFFAGTEEDAIVAVIHKRLDYLQLDEPGVRKYARDLAAIRLISPNRLRFLNVAGPLYSHLHWERENFLTSAIKHGEERIVSNYLLSSDFFRNGSDTSRLVHYIEYYDPLRACSNPFARPMSWEPGGMPAS
jgi:hypothetical protein